jgi:hypothetical protein
MSPENQVQLTLAYLSGGTMIHLRRLIGTSRKNFYNILYRVLDATSAVDDLNIQFPNSVQEIYKSAARFMRDSENNLFKGCIGCIDGWLCVIEKPHQADIGRVGQAKYFSGHYMSYGLNVLAVCDAECRAIYVNVHCPGSVSDSIAYSESNLAIVIEELPPGYHIIGDGAYIPTEHMLTPFTGSDRSQPQNDVFNFYLSQLRTKIERLFGFLTTKWRIFRRPLQASLQHNLQVILGAFRLTNYCISERLLLDDSNHLDQSDIQALDIDCELADHLRNNDCVIDASLGFLPSDVVNAFSGHSNLRSYVCEIITTQGYSRSTMNQNRRTSSTTYCI